MCNVYNFDFPITMSGCMHPIRYWLHVFLSGPFDFSCICVIVVLFIFSLQHHICHGEFIAIEILLFRVCVSSSPSSFFVAHQRTYSKALCFASCVTFVLIYLGCGLKKMLKNLLKLLKLSKHFSFLLKHSAEPLGFQNVYKLFCNMEIFEKCLVLKFFVQRPLPLFYGAAHILLCCEQMCPGLKANEIQIPCDKHHKVSSFMVKSYQNTHNSVKYEAIWKCQKILPNMKYNSILDMSGCELTVNKVQNKWKWVLSE